MEGQIKPEPLSLSHSKFCRIFFCKKKKKCIFHFSVLCEVSPQIERDLNLIKACRILTTKIKKLVN